MLRVIHGVLLIGQFGRAARLTRAWWLLLILPLIVVALALVGTAKVVVPYAVYTVF